LSAVASKLVPAVVLTIAGLRFVVTGVYQLTSTEAWEDAAGMIGLVLAGFAVYAAYAAEFEDVLKRPLLPLGRRGKGEQAVKGTYAEQIANVAHEPGVRQQL
jgi:succinate-acetate transporter protein